MTIKIKLTLLEYHRLRKGIATVAVDSEGNAVIIVPPDEEYVLAGRKLPYEEELSR